MTGHCMAILKGVMYGQTNGSHRTLYIDIAFTKVTCREHSEAQINFVIISPPM